MLYQRSDVDVDVIMTNSIIFYPILASLFDAIIRFSPSHGPMYPHITLSVSLENVAGFCNLATHRSEEYTLSEFVCTLKLSVSATWVDYSPDLCLEIITASS